MKAIVLAAGEGRRLKPLTENTPKVMLPVANRPILHYVVDAIVGAGIRDIQMVVGYHSEKIRRYFGDGGRFGASINYSIQEKQLGTAHALYQAKTDEEVIVLPGDNIISSECVKAMLDAGPNSILATYSRDSSKYGVVEHRRGEVISITEKPPNRSEDLVFTGLGRYDGSIFQHIRDAMEDGIYDMTGALNRMKGLRAVISSCLWKDAVYPWDLLELNSWAMKGIEREISGKVETSVIHGDVIIGDGTVISGGCYIRGPVVIGKNCYIGPNTVILGNTSIGDDVHIGAMGMIKNSIIMSSTSIRHRADMEDTIVGCGVEIGAGTTLLRSRWERVLDGDVLSRDSGPVIGENCIIGPLSVIHPGVRIHAGSRTRPQSTVKDDIGPHEEVV